MSWRKITMKFPGTCIVCGERISANEVGLWSKGVGVKHEKCAQVKELSCIICKGPAGCAECEFQEMCDIERVSEFCICRRCAEAPDPLAAYQNSAAKKFPALHTD